MLEIGQFVAISGQFAADFDQTDRILKLGRSPS
jgi:hypothetical protein